MEVDDVNKKELAKQMREEILKREHVKIEILVGKDSTDPMCLFINKGTSFREIGLAYNCLGEMKKTIEQKFPASVLYAKEFVELEERTEIDVNK